MHNAAIRALGLDAVYVAIRPPAAALPPLLAALGAVGGAGNVTVPHKEAVERCLARKTDLCARVGACNTFWTEQGALVGDNTDVAGVLASLKQLGADGADRWLLIGTGGAARAVAVAAAQARAELHVLSRDAARAGVFAEWATSRGARAQAARGALLPEVAINATPLGLKEADPLPLERSRDFVCPLCRHRWRPVVPPWCERCGQPEPLFGRCRVCRDWPAALRQVRSAVWLDGAARRAVHALKYGGLPRIAADLAA